MEDLDIELGVLDELEGEMDDREVSMLTKKKEKPIQDRGFAGENVRPDWIPGDGTESGVEFSESVSEDGYDDDEKEYMESEEYLALMG